MGEGGFCVESQHRAHPCRVSLPSQRLRSQKELHLQRMGRKPRNRAEAPSRATRGGAGVADGEGPEVLWACGVLGSSEAHQVLTLRAPPTHPIAQV